MISFRLGIFKLMYRNRSYLHESNQTSSHLEKYESQCLVHLLLIRARSIFFSLSIVTKIYTFFRTILFTVNTIIGSFFEILFYICVESDLASLSRNSLPKSSGVYTDGSTIPVSPSSQGNLVLQLTSPSVVYDTPLVEMNALSVDSASSKARSVQRSRQHKNNAGSLNLYRAEHADDEISTAMERVTEYAESEANLRRLETFLPEF